MNHEPELSNILEVNLAYANLEVISARSGVEALVKAAAERPDVILIDDGLPDLEAPEICRRLKESPQTGHIPLVVVGAEGRKPARAAGGDSYIAKPFDPKEVVALVRACLRQVERAENVSPPTGLPNQTQVNNELSSLIEQHQTFAAIYLDLDDFKAFNKVYGFVQGDLALGLLAELLGEAVRQFGNPDDLVGHLGADDFVVLTTPQKARVICRRIIADFDSRVRNLYQREDLQRGYIEHEGRLGQPEQYPVMCLRAAVVTNQKRVFHHYLEAAEAAREQMAYLRRFPGSNCCFDLYESDSESEPDLLHNGMPRTRREELKTLEGVLAWVAFLAREIDIPITVVKDCLEQVEPTQAMGLTLPQENALKTIREYISKLGRVVEELAYLTRDEWIIGRAVLEEVDLGNALEWVGEQVKELAEERGVKLDIEGAEGARIMVDGRSLVQGLFFALRSEVKSSSPGDQVQIRVSEKSKGFLTIELINRSRYIPPRELVRLLQGQLEGMFASGQRNDLYLARVLMQSLGGKLSLESERGEGTTFTILVPMRWRGSREEVNALLSAAETSKKEARAQLESLRRLLSPSVKQEPSIKENLENLGYKVQELLVLCNRSLFLADELANQTENQQDQLLRHEVAEMATAEAVLAFCREIARLMHVRNLFDADSARRVSGFALAIAGELRLSGSDRRALQDASLLKDLALVSFTTEMMEQMVAPTLEKANALKSRFNLVWRALSPVDFLSPALALLRHRYERFDGAGSPSGDKGASIPLGARILAVADTFESLTSGVFSQGTAAPRAALQMLLADSGQRFDPDVVSAFVKAWKKKESRVALKNTG